MSLAHPALDDPQTFLDLDDKWCAHNYSPLPVVAASAEGAWITDVAGKKYLDMLAGYSALNFGHRHPALIAATIEQLNTVTLTSRAFHHNQLGPFCEELAELTGTEMVLPMNSGAEAVESALKVARKWAYQVKGVPENQAQIITAGGNFHGRTISIVSFSDDPVATADYGPFTPGFVGVKYGDIEAFESAITPHTAAVLIEPIQGEAGVVVPPAGYMAAVRKLCTEHNVLMIADEIQSGLGRTGATLALDHEGVRADLYTLGKALGGGILPVSAVVGSRAVLGVLQPGTHGSTFGGNPLAAAVGRAVITLLKTGEMQERATRLGDVLLDKLSGLVGHGVAEVRGRGLWAGVELSPGGRSGKEVSKALAKRGILVKETQITTLRFAPPIVVTEAELTGAVDTLADILAE
ncbi:ornithine--oxo-acid transaminase [Nakamurella antarctica]|uniref:ornithine aminotransferase n=1 Tax=Nakamurella antarctica TaxID=1902245 RepID=A0A3G8ZLQ5_9ACTN|nr:ornithine--oxo-acid transaminase [Nakamurella antarctica]AZI57707.1 ornithine--oxo-acid transaminase [Nakamurella antarctica]